MKELSRSGEWRKSIKDPLSQTDQKRFMDFVKKDPRFHRWYTLFTFLLGTGCRVGEVVGIHWQDIDLEKEIIDINHGVYYLDKLREGKLKTTASYRIIPMLPEVKEALITEMHSSQYLFEETDDWSAGKKGYVFLNSRMHPHIPQTINQAINHIIFHYNQLNPENPLPHFSVHTFRHTFCTRLCENDVNIKVIQSIMGHSDIQTTMNIYADVSARKKQLALQGLEGKVIL